jgi:hypothetical protein
MDRPALKQQVRALVDLGVPEEEARHYTRRYAAQRIEELRALRQQAAAVRRAPSSAWGSQSQWKCPECGDSLVEKLNRSSGTAFLGCRRFPVCNYTDNKVSEKQVTYLVRLGLRESEARKLTRSQASKAITFLNDLRRDVPGLGRNHDPATPGQVGLLINLGVPRPVAERMNCDEAAETILNLLNENAKRHEPATLNQIEDLVWLGMRKEDAEKLTRPQAAKEIQVRYTRQSG